MCRKRSFIIVFALFGFFSGAFCQQADLHRFNDFVMKHYQLSDSLKTDCYFNYAVMLISSNLKGEVTKIAYLNDAHPHLKKNFEQIRQFKFTPSMKVNGRPVLLIGCVNQKNEELCPVLYPYEETPRKVMRETVEIVKRQLAIDPRTILSRVLIADITPDQ